MHIFIVGDDVMRGLGKIIGCGYMRLGRGTGDNRRGFLFLICGWIGSFRSVIIFGAKGISVGGVTTGEGIGSGVWVTGGVGDYELPGIICSGRAGAAGVLFGFTRCSSAISMSCCA